MARNVALADDVYEQLERLKRKGESFSEVIRRLLRTRGKISDLEGSSTLSYTEWAELLDSKRKQDELDIERSKSMHAKVDGGK